jgi:hypothetical protein
MDLLKLCSHIPGLFLQVILSNILLFNFNLTLCFVIKYDENHMFLLSHFFINFDTSTRSHTTTKMNDNVNMENTMTRLMNARLYMTNICLSFQTDLTPWSLLKTLQYNTAHVKRESMSYSIISLLTKKKRMIALCTFITSMINLSYF